MDYDYTGARVKKFGPLGQTLYPFPGYEIGPDGTKTKFFRLGNEMLASKQSLVSNPEKKVFYHNDHLGGVNVISDEAGARVQLTEYDPWGKVSRSEGNVDPENRFTGQKLDPESGLYYYGARYYDPDLGRFISPDSIVPDAGDPQSHNRYSYVRNNPVKYIDPTGHSFLSFLDGFLKVFSFIAKYAMPVFRLASGVLELMGGNILSGLSSIASSMSSFIKNSQFQFGSQIFGFFASAAAASSGGGAAGGTSSEAGATADAGLSGGGVDSGGVDSGGGPINLGTGGFNYLEKTSTGDYQTQTYDPYKTYDGETTFTFVREAGATTLNVDAPSMATRIIGGTALILTGASAIASGLAIGRIGGQIFMNEFNRLSQPGVGAALAGTGSLGALRLVLEPIHLLQGAGLTYTFAVGLSFGGGFLIGTGVNYMVPYLGQGELGRDIYDRVYPQN